MYVRPFPTTSSQMPSDFRGQIAKKFLVGKPNGSPTSALAGLQKAIYADLPLACSRARLPSTVSERHPSGDSKESFEIISGDSGVYASVTSSPEEADSQFRTIDLFSLNSPELKVSGLRGFFDRYKSITKGLTGLDCVNNPFIQQFVAGIVRAMSLELPRRQISHYGGGAFGFTYLNIHASIRPNDPQEGQKNYDAFWQITRCSFHDSLEPSSHIELQLSSLQTSLHFDEDQGCYVYGFTDAFPALQLCMPTGSNGSLTFARKEALKLNLYLKSLNSNGAGDSELPKANNNVSQAIDLAHQPYLYSVKHALGIIEGSQSHIH
jgi:hypothetical protein